MIVGTDLKRIERITGRLTSPGWPLGGLISGMWFGLFVGLVMSLFQRRATPCDHPVDGPLRRAVRRILALPSYASHPRPARLLLGHPVVATRYEVLVEHKSAAQAREMLAKLPGGRPDPFAADATPPPTDPIG